MRSYSAASEQAPAAGPYLSYHDILGRFVPPAQGKKQFRPSKPQTGSRYFFGAAEKFAFNTRSISVNSPLPSNMSAANGP